MAEVLIFDTYTKRKRRAQQTGPEPQRHDNVPDKLRRQIVFIWREALGVYRRRGPYDFSPSPPANERWDFICGVLLRERGEFSLTGKEDDPFTQCVHLLLSGDTDDALEVIEVSFRFIEFVMPKVSPYRRREEGLEAEPDEAIEELNGRLREHGVGYRYENGQIVHVDSDLLHQEVTVPAIALLREPGFSGPLQEFMNAHDHYRKGEIKDANVDALNSFESTLKAICDARKWTYAAGATASRLVQVVLDNELVPRALQSQFEHLIKTLETGLPTIRNKMGGHGQGATHTAVDPHLGSYALHLLGATIVLLIGAHKVEP